MDRRFCRNLELSNRIRELSELNASMRYQLQQLQQQQSGVTLDKDTAVVINMHPDSEGGHSVNMRQHRHIQDPRMRAQSEWLAREQRKLARAKEQYAKDIRDLQRKAESSLAKVLRNEWETSFVMHYTLRRGTFVVQNFTLVSAACFSKGGTKSQDEELWFTIQ